MRRRGLAGSDAGSGVADIGSFAAGVELGVTSVEAPVSGVMLSRSGPAVCATVVRGGSASSFAGGGSIGIQGFD